MLLTIFLLLVMLWAAVIDSRFHRIPNRLIFLAWMVIILGDLHKGLHREVAISAVSALFLICGLLIHQLSRRAIGMGDVKALAVIGAYFGDAPSALRVLLYASIAALPWAVIFRKRNVSFAPFLAIGVILVSNGF